MLFDDTYRTIAAQAEGIYRDKGSKFLAIAIPIRSYEDIKPVIVGLRVAHPKANHHCWAARLTPDRNNFKLNDDGEPSGTAGRPILNTLLSQDLTNILVVVTRYFGGSLLGVPGLINAYRSATVEALNDAKVIENTINDIYQVNFNHEYMNPVMRIIKERDLRIRSQTYVDDNQMELEIRKTAVSQVIDALHNLRAIKIKYLYSE